MRASLFVALHPYVRRRSPDIACPQRRERHDDEHGREHVDHGKDFDAAHAQPRSDEDDAAAGVKSLSIPGVMYGARKAAEE